MCNFSGMIKNVLPSLRQRAGPQRICSRQKSIRSGTARDSFSQTPHMRGKVRSSERSFSSLGITPACAGKRYSPPRHPLRIQDHPRMCGEKTKAYIVYGHNEGSPPHVRGKEADERRKRQTHGITPAHAGKSARPPPQQRAGRDHPRTCGEKNGAAPRGSAARGSPPHMRGKVRLFRPLWMVSRITPAHAGKRVERKARGV